MKPADSSVELFDKRLPWAIDDRHITGLQSFDAAGHQMHNALDLRLRKILIGPQRHDDRCARTILLRGK